MDTMVKIYIERAKNELDAAEVLKRISGEARLKAEFRLSEKLTFYSSVISHSYYAIFYAAKALLLAKNIKTAPPDIHKKTYEEFEKTFVDTGILDMKLLEIYRKLVIRADELLKIFSSEKWKRGNFTYKTIPQANKEPAEDSLKNAKVFVSNINSVSEKI